MVCLIHFEEVVEPAKGFCAGGGEGVVVLQHLHAFAQDFGAGDEVGMPERDVRDNAVGAGDGVFHVGEFDVFGDSHGV